jgi:hypothetical protein
MEDEEGGRDDDRVGRSVLCGKKHVQEAGAPPVP